MAIVEISNQYKYAGKGPVDSKQLVKRYSELLDKNTWTTSAGSNTAYNGMIVSVWMNNEDTEKNGIYYLFDPACTTPIKNPDITNESNWHRLGENTLSEDDIQTLINNLRDELDVRYVKNDDAFAALKQKSIDNANAIKALIADDTDKSIREITNKVIEEQLSTPDSALGAINTLSQDNKNALNALIKEDVDKSIRDISIEASREEISRQIVTKDTPLNKLVLDIGDINQAVKSLIGQDEDKSIREIAEAEIDSQLADDQSSLGNLVLRIGTNEQAIEALKKNGGVSEEDLYAALTKFDADVLIDDSDEIVVENRQLKIKELGISKLFADVSLILHGGSAKVSENN